MMSAHSQTLNIWRQILFGLSGSFSHLFCTCHVSGAVESGKQNQIKSRTEPESLSMRAIYLATNRSNNSLQ